MQYRILYFMFLALYALESCSKNDEPEALRPVAGDIVFSDERTMYSDMLLPYRKAVMLPADTGKPALVLYLHGGTSKGTDNAAPMKEKGVGVISGYLAAHRINAIFIVPQCPKDKSWGGRMNAVLKALLDEYIAGGTVDVGRIYVFGGSMGGSGTWSMLSSYPGLFAAAMPVAGNPSECDAKNVAATPILTVMGTSDKIMDVAIVRNFVNRLVVLQDDALLEIEEGWTHEVTCTESYTESRLDWVFGHRRD